MHVGHEFCAARTLITVHLHLALPKILISCAQPVQHATGPLSQLSKKLVRHWCRSCEPPRHNYSASPTKQRLLLRYCIAGLSRNYLGTAKPSVHTQLPSSANTSSTTLRKRNQQPRTDQVLWQATDIPENLHNLQCASYVCHGLCRKKNGRQTLRCCQAYILPQPLPIPDMVGSIAAEPISCLTSRLQHTSPRLA